MQLAIAVSRVAACEETHTTIHIAAEALDRGHDVLFVEPWDFGVEPSARVVARSHHLSGPLGREEIVRLLAERKAPRVHAALDRFDVLLLRTNPLNPGVLAFATLARRLGVIVHNDPSTLVLTGHKGYLAAMPEVPRPATLVTRSRTAATLFAAKIPSGVVVKPARSSGGRGVSLVVNPRQRGRFEAAFELARVAGDAFVVVQEYLPEAEHGEKRLVWLKGELIGGYRRERAPGEFRHNLTCGGLPLPCEIEASDLEIAGRVSPRLLADGVWLAGLDVIGQRLIEVNTLNPGGMHFGDRLGGTRMASRIVRTLEGEVLECARPPGSPPLSSPPEALKEPGE
jgi:glutathione synthase